MQQPLAYIPSPSQGVWHLGPLPIRAYAIMIIIGIVVAVWLGERRWAARGGTPGMVIDIAVWAVPFGLLGGRLYHVITDYELYFGPGKDPIGALEIWKGGLGIWGAVVLGGVGAAIGCHRQGVNLRAFADVIAPGIVFAQGIGRWGNWFNQELYGRPLNTFWALKIDPAHRPTLPDGQPDPRYIHIGTYTPTFLYESLWCIGVGFLVIWAGKRFRLNWGRTFALYVASYTVGRAWIEWLRIDDAHRFFGLRLNDYTAIIVLAGALAYLYVYRDKGDTDEILQTLPTPVPAVPADSDSGTTADTEAGGGAVAGDEPEDGAEPVPAGPTGSVPEPEPVQGAEPAEPGPGQNAGSGTEIEHEALEGAETAGEKP